MHTQPSLLLTGTNTGEPEVEIFCRYRVRCRERVVPVPANTSDVASTYPLKCSTTLAMH